MQRQKKLILSLRGSPVLGVQMGDGQKNGLLIYFS